MHHKSNLSMTSRASRLLLLNDAYNSSKLAVNLCPNSMSCVALKACLVISRLVENVAVISRKVRVDIIQQCVDNRCEIGFFFPVNTALHFCLHIVVYV